ncbi:MAG TPA: FliH/SctL family protein [Candidatus Acidoferrum sp.]|jgi:flagellar assembly protein FliH
MSSERAATQKRILQSEPYNYLPSGGASDLNEIGGNGSTDSHTPNIAPARVLEQREKQGFEQGLQEGEARMKNIMGQALAASRVGVVKAVEEFKVQRESYFNRIEPEVVQLALSIARKILHREVQMDPLLLAGMVHVALEKVEQGTRVRLRAHPDEIHFWNKHFSDASALSVSPEIIGDATLQRGECALETEIGNTQICLDTQLKEIEQGFFDLLEQRPAAR